MPPSVVPRLTPRAAHAALALLLVTAGCDAVLGGSRYLEGEVVPGTTRRVAEEEGGSGIGYAEAKVSPDGRSVAFTEGGAVWVVGVATGERRRVGAGRNADWSPDGARLAFNDGADLFTAGADGADRRPLGALGQAFFPDWSPDGRSVAFDRSLPDALGPAGVWAIGADGASPRPVCGAAYPEWAPDGRSILAIQGRPGDEDERYEFVRCDAVTGAEAALPLRGLYDHSHPRLSPDGTRLVYETARGVWVAAADGRWARRVLPNDLADPRAGRRRTAATGPSWHPDGRRVVYEHLRIESYGEGPYGPVVRGEASIRLLDVDAALRASEL